MSEIPSAPSVPPSTNPPPNNPQASMPIQYIYPHYPFITRRIRHWNILAGFLVPLVTYIIVVIFSVIIGIIALLLNTSFWVLTFITGIGSILFFFAPLLWMGRYYPQKLTFSQRLAEIGLPLSKYTRKEWVREILLGICLAFFSVLIVIGLQELATLIIKWIFQINVALLMENENLESFSLTTPQTFLDLLLFIATMVFFVGFPEEVMFRGFAQKSFENKMTKPAALLLTAIYFSLFHIYIAILIPPVFLFLLIPYIGISIILGVVRNWRNDLLAVSILHIIYNITQTTILYFIFS